MDCTRARSLLHPWMDGELDREDHCSVLEHLGKCEQCDARFRDEQRLLGRVKDGLKSACPAELRARLLANIAGAHIAGAAPAGRGGIISFRAAAAAAAVFVVAFVGVDPLCMRGCSNVRALAYDHRAAMPAIVTTQAHAAAAAAEKFIGEPVTECMIPCCDTTGLECLGVKPVACATKGCMILYRDRGGRKISFVKMKAGVHPWIRFRASADGLMSTRQDGCRFVGWKDGDGITCGLVADESVDQGELVALSEKVRGAR